MSVAQSEEDYLPDLISNLVVAQPQIAIKMLKEAASKHPTDPRPYLLLGSEYTRARKLDEAEASYIVALRRAPGYVLARFQLGMLQYTSGRPIVASLTWRSLSKLPEQHEYRLFKQGLEALADGNFERASHFLKLGVNSNKKNLPLNKDMQAILDEISKRQNKPVPIPEHALPPRKAGTEKNNETENEDLLQHFLVSTYNKLH